MYPGRAIRVDSFRRMAPLFLPENLEPRSGGSPSLYRGELREAVAHCRQRTGNGLRVKFSVCEKYPLTDVSGLG
jgi:hypothetical protein